jgi:hypothetical protein
MTTAAPTNAEPRVWWHGCWLKPGHYLFDRRGDDGRSMEPCPVRPSGSIYEAPWLDAGLAPRRARARSWTRLPIEIPADQIVFSRMAGDDRDLRQRVESASEECPQGEFLLHTIAGCTVAAWWDRTQGDTRGACNSCLIVENRPDRGWSASEMLDLFPRLFPVQAARLAAAGVTLRFLRWASP